MELLLMLISSQASILNNVNKMKGNDHVVVPFFYDKLIINKNALKPKMKWTRGINYAMPTNLFVIKLS